MVVPCSESLKVLPFDTLPFNTTDPALTEIASLGINDDPPRQAPFAGHEAEPPPAPKLHSRGVVAMEITAQFKQAAERNYANADFCSKGSRANQFAELKLGELIKDPFFTLYESVGALEVRKKLKILP